MGFKATHNPDVIESRQGGGCFILLGLPFFLAGTAVILLGFGVLPAKNASCRALLILSPGWHVRQAGLIDSRGYIVSGGVPLPPEAQDSSAMCSSDSP